MRARITTGVMVGFATLGVVFLKGPVAFVALCLVSLCCIQELTTIIGNIPFVSKDKEARHMTMIQSGMQSWGLEKGQIKRLIDALFCSLLVAMVGAMLAYADYGVYILTYVLANIVLIWARGHRSLDKTCLWISHASVLTLILIASGLLGFYQLQKAQQWQLVYVIGLTALSDISGFFVGKKWGKIKIFSKISPNKTEYGTVAMIASPAIGALVLSFCHGIKLNSFWLSIGVFALMGDLWISTLKRIACVKDTGAILPGHGGILDRMDSHLLVLAVAWLALI